VTVENPAQAIAPAETEGQAAQPPAPPPTRILLIRHGVNDYVKTHRLACRLPGVHLNAEGTAQAEAMAQRLSSTEIHAVYSSPLERAQETAAPLGRTLNLEVQVIDGIMETDCGEWAGQKIEDLNKLDLWKQLQVYPSGVRFPGGESFADIQARMVATIEKLSTQHAHQTIALVSHADPIKLALAFYAGIPLDLFQRLVIAPASITEIEFGLFRPAIVRINDCAHIPPSPEAPAEEEK
jgi:probable phosphomutase (TIGR03848 family)